MKEKDPKPLFDPPDPIEANSSLPVKTVNNLKMAINCYVTFPIKKWLLEVIRGPSVNIFGQKSSKARGPFFDLWNQISAGNQQMPYMVLYTIMQHFSLEILWLQSQDAIMSSYQVACAEAHFQRKAFKEINHSPMGGNEQ
ncbi:hypothetical protein O181_113270 [Austropuccinia psidii MF-1]|uniref:Uncharacterized protein n=1 Tax=Austropuccinia psidii MF-1 TaxID=1389203 RepID=A0A9Q3K260_9BASI|nr:hypothetical protein [Austropuccinia psidii MF-1]